MLITSSPYCSILLAQVGTFRTAGLPLAGFLAHPSMTVECIYVPLMMAASKAADELSIASVTRGIENPHPRTCLVQIKCGAADWGVMAVAVAFLIFELCVRGGVIG